MNFTVQAAGVLCYLQRALCFPVIPYLSLNHLNVIRQHTAGTFCHVPFALWVIFLNLLQQPRNSTTLFKKNKIKFDYTCLKQTDLLNLFPHMLYTMLQDAPACGCLNLQIRIWTLLQNVQHLGDLGHGFERVTLHSPVWKFFLLSKCTWQTSDMTAVFSGHTWHMDLTESAS